MMCLQRSNQIDVEDLLHIGVSSTEHPYNRNSRLTKQNVVNIRKEKYFTKNRASIM